MPGPFDQFIRSPLYRHPFLLRRKILTRLGRTARFRFEEPPPGLVWQTVDEWSDRLVSWIAAVGPVPAPVPWTRLFHREFNEADLLARCRTGPPTSSSLEGDIKLIWEFSRLQAVFLAAAQQPENSHDGNARWIRAWLDANRDPDGINWTNAMEVAIRAVNLIAADSLSGGWLRRALGERDWLYWMWNHARAIDARIEARLVSSNHYLADLLGLAVIGSHLRGHAQAGIWRRFAADEFQAALAAQSFPDGGVYEASLPYHALVTEMALLTAALPGHQPSDEGRDRLARMCRVLADLTDADGDVFRFGDDDGGRILPLDFIAGGRGRAQLLLDLARVLGLSTASSGDVAVYPDSGWARLKHGPWMLAAEFGGVGFRGRGGHAHNDTLSFCLNWNNQPLFIDPGSFLYTPDPAARVRFRSAAVHNTLRFDGKDHHHPPANPRELFQLPGPEEAAKVIAASQNALSLQYNFPSRPIRVGRSFNISRDAVVLNDSIEPSGTVDAQWSFHLAPGLRPEVAGGTARFSTSSGRVTLSAPDGMTLAMEPGQCAPFYGSRVDTVILTARTKVSTPVRLAWKITGE